MTQDEKLDKLMDITARLDERHQKVSEDVRNLGAKFDKAKEVSDERLDNLESDRDGFKGQLAGTKWAVAKISGASLFLMTAISWFFDWKGR